MNKTFNNQIDEYSNWRAQLSDSIQSMSRFLKTHNITDIKTHHQFEDILGALADDNFSIAFVAESSRGKSDLINAIFFGHHKQPILPPVLDRTMMCSVELMFDPNRPTSIRLLPIESRADQRPLSVLKNKTDLWNEIIFDEEDPKRIRKALASMTNNKLVSKNYAKKLNINVKQETETDSSLSVNKKDEVVIPNWRHAVINLPHPLLEKGLVVLDISGLDTINSEPELTLNQLSSAHTIVFIVAHDTGITKSDIELWEQHLRDSPKIESKHRHLVALNKIDSLWNKNLGEEEINQEIKKLSDKAIKTLNIDPKILFPISAHEGLIGKIQNDQKLLERSCICDLENAIVHKLIPEKRHSVISKVQGALDHVLDSSQLVLNNRLNDVDEHIAELKQLSAKNSDVISHIMVKAQSEKNTLEVDIQRYQALREIYETKTSQLISKLHEVRLEKLIAVTKYNMARCASSITLQRTITKYFKNLNGYLDQASSKADEIAVLSENIVNDFKHDPDNMNFKVRRLRLDRYKHEVARLERKHSNLKETKTLFFKEQTSITNIFHSSVNDASRQIFKSAYNDAVNWNSNLMVPMETYVREHHTQLRRRLESVKRIHKASDTVDSRLQELSIIKSQLHEHRTQFNSLKDKIYELLVNNIDHTGNKEESKGKILNWQQKNII